MRRCSTLSPRVLTHGVIIAVASAVVGIAALAGAQIIGGKPPAPGQPPEPPTPGPIIEKKQPADLAASPADFAKMALPNGNLIGDIKSPIQHGQFTILPTGSVPKPPATALGTTTRSETPTYEEWAGASLQDAAQRAPTLRVVVPYTPPGWSIAEVRGLTAHFATEPDLTMGVTLHYERDRYFPIGVAYAPIGHQFEELVNPGPDTQLAMTLATVRGVPVVVTHQAPGAAVQPPTNALWVFDGTRVSVFANALPVDDLLRITESIIAAQEAGQ